MRGAWRSAQSITKGGHIEEDRWSDRRRSTSSDQAIDDRPIPRRQAGAVARAVSVGIAQLVASDRVLIISSSILRSCHHTSDLEYGLLRRGGPGVTAREAMKGIEPSPRARPLEPTRVRPAAKRTGSLPCIHRRIVASADWSPSVGYPTERRYPYAV
jgi:hypothetical protein